MTPHKDAAIGFLTLVAAGEVAEAYRQHIGPGFRHHNPHFQGDADSLMAAMAENAGANRDLVLEVQRTLEDGDQVAVLSWIRQHPADRGTAVVHLFRFEGDRIAEMWDIGQGVPGDMVNVNGMF